MKAVYLYLFLIGLTFAPNIVSGQECELSFNDLKDGSVIRSWPVGISGVAKNVPEGKHVWILAHSENEEGLWYPQGGTERQVPKWRCNVHLGNGQETGLYEIAIVVVDNAENEKLKKWVTATQSGGYYAIEVSHTCAKIVKVEKK